MPNIKSAKKRVSVNAKKNAQNVSKQSEVKTALKKINTAIDLNDMELAQKLLPEVYSVLDKAVIKGLMHRNTAANKKSGIAKRIADILAGKKEVVIKKDNSTIAAEKAKAAQAKRDAERAEKKAAAESLLASAKEIIGDLVRPADGTARENMLKAQAVYESKAEENGIIREQLKSDRDALNALLPKMDERRKTVDDHTKLDTLYRLVTGKVAGSRMDLETYVQRYYLERILYAANLRFSEMSAGQFELRMYDLDKAGEGKNKGLDLMVYSSVTGKEREVRTLSGGESFMAALSLALGMADQIQERSAAVNLDVMFIDEGFGSLDDHSRNQAVRVLMNMAGGSKLIGIISHVTELKQEIDNQLVVTKDDEGSHVSWQIS